MNTTTNKNNQNAFNYAMYMMLGSYFKQMSAASDYYIKKMYLYYIELGKEKQYRLEDIVIDFAEKVLQCELPEEIWREQVKIFFREENDCICVAFVGDRYTLIVESNYRGKRTKLKYKVKRNVSSIKR